MHPPECPAQQPRSQLLGGDNLLQLGLQLEQFSAERLTSREWEVLELLAQGRSTAEIAGGLVITTSAVRAHITAIVRKLNVTGRAAAIELFRERSDPNPRVGR